MRALNHVCGLAHQWRLAWLGVAKTDLDLERITQVALGNAVDAWWQRGRKHHGLARVGGGFENLFDVFGEAHVEHLVGFVEHHHLDVAQRQRAASNVVHRATRRSNNYVYALA